MAGRQLAGARAASVAPQGGSRSATRSDYQKLSLTDRLACRAFFRRRHHPFLGKNNRRADGEIVGEPLDSWVLRHPITKPPPAVWRHALIWVPSLMGGQETTGAGNGHGSRN